MRFFKHFHKKKIKEILTGTTMIPYILLFCVLFLSLFFIIANCKKQIRENCKQSLVQLSQSLELELSNVMRSTTSLYNSEALMDYLQNKDTLDSNEEEFKVTSAISQLKNDNSMIQDIIIIDKNTNRVISTNGNYPLTEFFSEICSYANYPAEYWTKYNSFSHSSYTILPPTVLGYSEETVDIIPIVINSIASTNLAKTIVVNFSINALSSNISRKITPNSNLYILSRYNGDVFGVGANYEFGNILDSNLYNNLISDKEFVDNSYKGKKSLYIPSNLYSKNFLSFTYFTAIPYSDIYRSQGLIITGLFVFYIAFLFISIYLAKKYKEASFSMISGIAFTLNPDNASNINSHNVFENINSSVASLRKNDLSLKMLLPFSQEKYLMDYLTSTVLHVDENVKEYINTSLPFKKDYFAVVIFQFFTKQAFFDIFSLEQYDTIFYGLGNVLESIFSHSFDAFFLSQEKEIMYIILNSDNPDDMAKINSTLKEIYTIIQYDNQHINVYTGAGNFYEGLEGMKKSYNEALLSIKHVPLHGEEMSFSKSSSYENVLTKQNESDLYDALISLDTTEAKRLINSIVVNLSNIYTIKHIYIQVIYIILKVLQVYNIYNSELSDSSMTIMDKPCKHIYSYILRLLNIIDEHKNTLNARQNGDEIIDYIKSNFNNPDISLDFLAQQFNISSGYVSQLVKKNIGTNFREYLLNLRIINAKKLLSETDKKIQDIAIESGFYSKQTFFRIFKSNVGITPSEFRKKMM